MTKEERAIKNREWAQARKEALTTILGYLNTVDELPSEVEEALNVYNKKKAVISGKKAEILACLEEGALHENELFTNYKVGRTEARTMFNSFLKVKPENRIWIAFDRETETYAIKGKGAEMPEGWDGYVPADVQVESDDNELFDSIEDTDDLLD